MKLICLLLFATSCAYAQLPTTVIRRDSMPSVFPPDLMPNVRPNNSFYRYPTDSPNVVRATLDNMPVKVPDSSTNYTMMRSFQPYVMPQQQPQLFLKPMPRVVPKKFK
ncbi:hypothetical protein GO755_09085 [Spirosoma sp. HMF4905]|uniref:Uncharacterized protein n=1 Tax=Spirosoma arboris TaxID=2682092 RepID=A0A7K1S9G9_9BACT|nr:hypothetical protein [Spirosoma arboris]MVM30186.1 hypothetical protein [Spirosoma arboris]